MNYSHLLRDQEFLLRTIVLFLFFWVINQGLVGPAMDNDGVLYASIAKHLAEGHGSFWFPPSPYIGETSFHHHPPLALSMQALFFSLLGDAFWVENVYQVILLIFLLATLAGIWSELTESRSGAFLLWFFFLTMPLVAYTYTDNLLEVTLSFFTAFTIFCHIKSLRSKHWYFWSTLAGLGTCAAVLTKGPVGLFPLTALFILAWAFRIRIKQTLKCYAAYLLTILLVCSALFFGEAPRQSLASYVDFQLVGTMEGRLRSVYGRSYILIELARQIPLVLIAVIGLCLWARPRIDRLTVAWFIIALSAWLPLTISPRQLEWYIVPALPQFALFFALVVRPALDKFPLFRTTRLQVAAAAMVAGFFFSGFQNYGQPDKDIVLFHDLKVLQQNVPEGSEIGKCEVFDTLTQRYQWLLNRYHGIRFVSADNQQYILCETSNLLPAEYTEVAPELQFIPLYHLERNK